MSNATYDETVPGKEIAADQPRRLWWLYFDFGAFDRV